MSRSHGRKKVLMSVDGLTCSFVLAGANECRTRRRRRTAQTNRGCKYGYNEETVERRFRSGNKRGEQASSAQEMRPKP